MEEIMEDKSLIREKLLEVGIEVTEEKVEQLFNFYRMVIEKNKVMNLTAITEYEDFVLKHFVDSLLIAKVIDFSDVKTLLDIGTGAGFPGMPIKILFPEVEVLLLDSLNKRLLFLEEVIENLGLKGISTIHSRAEELQVKGEYRESFDIVVSRAVSALPTLSEYCLPYVKIGGSFVSYKGAIGEEEVDASKSAIKILGGKIAKKESFRLGESDRLLVVMEKVKNTPSKYPRGGGKPGKNPL